jgi:carbon storage regulator
MLVLSRKSGECLRIGKDIEATVLEIRGSRARLGFNVPSEIPVHRGEVYQRIEGWSSVLQFFDCA